LPHARRGLHGPFARLRVIPYPPPVIVALGLDSPNVNILATKPGIGLVKDRSVRRETVIESRHSEWPI
ncbi:hypothetical protein CN101_29365, partial [Sinorhizobium meliloti]